MEPGDEAQLNFLPGEHNKNKTFVSRMQCILSAIENQLQEVKKVDPKKKIGFVLFSDEVVLLGDKEAEDIHLAGDKLNSSEAILEAIKAFQFSTPIDEAYHKLIDSLNKIEAKGQTALGPALVASVELAARAGAGSQLILCTDGLANIGVGSLDPYTPDKKVFYDELALKGKTSNIVANIITIKGEGSKMEALGTIAELTNGNIKVVNPATIAEDFANVLRDEVVGLNVCTKIMLHKAMIFRNEEPEALKDNKTVLIKNLANATKNTRISFEYEVREEEDLKFMEIDIASLKEVPFQTQITYTNPSGAKFLRVISTMSKTTFEKQ